jgi:hypothetical protein
MKITSRFFFILILLAAGSFVAASLSCRRLKSVDQYTLINRPAQIKPDYSDAVIPPNIAPLNFFVSENGKDFFVKIHGNNGIPITIHSGNAKIKIPSKEWKILLKENIGNKVFFDIYTYSTSTGWKKYQTISNTIAREKIDPYLVYRFMRPIYNWWKDIGIYQRNLENYKNSVVLHGRSFSNGCLNCHTFLNNTPEKMTIGIRSANYGSSTLLDSNNSVSKIGTKWGYTSWHPSGKVAAYSLNKVRQFFHTVGVENRDVVDLDSAIAFYNVDTCKAKTIPALSIKERLETYPTWSPDGKYLYYCSAPILWKDRDTMPPEKYDQVKYDLMRISYDLQNDRWGQPETILSAKDTGLSILLPRISPDGKFLIFSMCDYGCFPIYRTSSDLYLMDLSNNQYTKLDTINTEYSESWHSFSTNSRWMAFSTKKHGGLFTRTYFTYIDENGSVSKPFILPQKDPTYYDSLLQTYSVPELVTQPIQTSPKAFARAVRSPDKIHVGMPITGATPIQQGSEPWQERE